MSNVLILGAAGHIARHAEEDLLNNTTNHLTYYLRNSGRIKITKPERESIIEGDVTDAGQLSQAMKNIDIVYANLSGHNIEELAKDVVSAMNANNVKRLIWISTLGIYDEVPGEYGKWNHQMLDGGYLETYSAAAKVIESSDLDYTIIRPAWLTNHDEVSYETTTKGEDFKGTEVSRKSIGYLVGDLIEHPDKSIRDSLGVNKPNTDGPKPAWY